MYLLGLRRGGRRSSQLIVSSSRNHPCASNAALPELEALPGDQFLVNLDAKSEKRQ
jgi:hypothetical protein